MYIELLPRMYVQAQPPVVPIDRVRVAPQDNPGFTMLRVRLRDRRQGAKPMMNWVFQRHLGTYCSPHPIRHAQPASSSHTRV